MWINVKAAMNRMERSTVIRIGIVFAVTVFLAVLLWIVDLGNGLPENEEGQSVLKRGDYGEGNQTQEIIASIKTPRGTKQEEIQITVGEKEYNLEELDAVFQQAITILEKEILGDNESLDEVRKNLNLVTKIPDSSIQVEWELSNYTLMNVKGELQQEKLKEGGTIEELTAILSYGEQKVMHTFSANLLPPLRTENEQLQDSLKKEVEQTEKEDKAKDTVILPESVGDYPVKWSVKKEPRGIYVLGIGILICALLAALEKQRIREREQERRKQLILDYPELVNKLTLLLGAGMTVKNAWMKLASDYENRMKGEHRRYVYEEMACTCHEMMGGMPEGESYERFGRRCGIQMYVKLGALLSQNLKKGTKGLTSLMKMESVQALEERKANAKRQGEEASTKLLAPMFLMLAIVLVIVIVPAFFSMQL